jgi:SAM-dependent methyltransferase
MRYYDRNNNRLVYLTGAALPDDWDERWSRAALESLFAPGLNAWLVAETRRYLNIGDAVLEGGCGCADKVYSLNLAGYKAFGFDTARKTLTRAVEVCPSLNIAVGDIRNLPLVDGSMDGYWSLGVFEHFREGMQEQWDEASRVLRAGGYLFLTVPIMSPLRRLKARHNAYKTITDVPKGSFYQYAYSTQAILDSAEASGFVLVSTRLLDGIKGLKDEVTTLKPVLQGLYDSKSLFARVMRRVVDAVFRPLTGHIGYFVFKRGDSAPDQEVF